MNALHELLAAAIVISIGALAGCDQRSEAPAPTTPAQPTPATLPAASQQPAVLQLGSLPFSIQAPPGWKIESLADKFEFLTGPAPEGTLQIALNYRPSAMQEQIDYLFRGAQSEQKKQPARYLAVTLAKLNNFQIFQVARLQTDDSDNAATAPATPGAGCDWTIAIFVPDDGRFQQYVLDFEGLTRSQYDADNQFFRQMLQTLQYRELPDPLQ